MTEQDIEHGRWCAKRLIKSTFDHTEPWMRDAAKAFLFHSKPGKTPSTRVRARLAAAWKAQKHPSLQLSDDLQVTE